MKILGRRDQGIRDKREGKRGIIGKLIPELKQFEKLIFQKVY